MSATTDTNMVVCTGDGLHFGYLNYSIESTIDTRNAGPGELTVFCNGPERRAFCELSEQQDGVFALIVRAQELGLHQLYIQYDGKNVPGSPFQLRVSPASLVHLMGPGLKDGLMHSFKGEFNVDTKDAGPGEVRVRIGGPPGSFKLKTKKKNKLLNCKYKPKKCGIYVINILWAGDHVPGSPFYVFICDNIEELDRYRRQTQV